jgi:predicted ABC-type ATPase
VPTLTVIAGANGSGKSTLTKLIAGDTLLIDPDAIAAARQAIILCQQYVRSDRSFMVETTLAGNIYLNLMRDVKQSGWTVELIYIGIVDSKRVFEKFRERYEIRLNDEP